MMRYEIIGGTLPAVMCYLDSGETMVTQRGDMVNMTPNMKMHTLLVGGATKAAGRMMAGDSAFQNTYTAMNGPGEIMFSSVLPGSIIPFELSDGPGVVLQRGAFLAAEDSVKFRVFINKRLRTGVFGGEGFILERFYGHGVVFAEFDGFAAQIDLGPNEQTVISTGHLAAMDASCSLDIRMITGARNVVFGQEGLFNVTVTGPGRVWIQTMTVKKLRELFTSGASQQAVQRMGN